MSEKPNELFTQEELDDLARTRRLRTNIIEEVMKTPANLANPEMATLLLKAADGMDKSALGGAKLRSGAKGAKDMQAQMASMIAAMYAKGMTPTPVTTSDKQAENTYQVPDLKPGEDAMGKVALTLDDISHIRTQVDTVD